MLDVRVRVAEGDGGEAVLALAGRLTLKENQELRRGLEQFATAATPGRPKVIDLSGLEFVDSAGLGLLLIAREQLTTPSGSRLVLRNASRSIANLFRLARFEEMFDLQEAKP